MSEAVLALERAELEAMADFYRAASRQTVDRARLAVHEVAGSVLMTVGAADVLAMNRLVGLGLGRPATAESVAEGLDAIAASGVPRALILRRLADARLAGCRWVSVETAEDSVVRDAPSFRMDARG